MTVVIALLGFVAGIALAAVVLRGAFMLRGSEKRGYRAARFLRGIAYAVLAIAFLVMLMSLEIGVAIVFVFVALMLANMAVAAVGAAQDPVTGGPRGT